MRGHGGDEDLLHGDLQEVLLPFAGLARRQHGGAHVAAGGSRSPAAARPCRSGAPRAAPAVWPCPRPSHRPPCRHRCSSAPSSRTAPRSRPCGPRGWPAIDAVELDERRRRHDMTSPAVLQLRRVARFHGPWGPTNWGCRAGLASVKDGADGGDLRGNACLDPSHTATWRWRPLPSARRRPSRRHRRLRPANRSPDTFHGVRVADPYRNLENIKSPQTQAWFKEVLN